MCTAVSFVTKDHYFGRNMDYEYSYEETVTITPRNFPISFRSGVNWKKKETEIKNTNSSQGGKADHYAMIGMAYVVDDYPLYYDGINEKGLGIAALLFSGNAVYSRKEDDGKDNIAVFELIPWILGQCGCIQEVEELLAQIRLTEEAFSDKLPPSPLHWMIADREKTIVVEAVAEGLKIYDNPVHVLTNNPSFDFHLLNLNHYLGLSSDEPVNRFAKEVVFTPFSRGMGAFGLPGDLSSVSRFVKAAFTRMNSVCDNSEKESVSQFFHILGSVYQQKGCVRIKSSADYDKEFENAKEGNALEVYEKTIYSSCCNATKGIYYYITYDNSCITAVDMNKEDLEGDRLISYPLVKEQQIYRQNENSV